MSSTLKQWLSVFGQAHVMAFWDRLNADQRTSLQHQLQLVDLEIVQELFARRAQAPALPSFDTLSPLPRVRLDPEDAQLRSVGEDAIRRGQVAAFMVAGGQGTRLGSDQPKGMYPVGPVSGKMLFQVQAEKLLASSRRYNVEIPLYIMTSPATHEPTTFFFNFMGSWGLTTVEFLTQPMLPALDATTGKLLLETPDRIYLSPNGHGGALEAMARAGIFEQLRQRGICYLAYFQVDNPLVRPIDPLLLGWHINRQAQVSTKVTAKRSPQDKVGNVTVSNGRCRIIEYSDLPDSLAERTDRDGSLLLWAGNTAYHLFDLSFLEQAALDPEALPYHVAHKKVPFIDSTGNRVEPSAPNGLKFERFIFDLLPRAERWSVVEVEREEEYAPLKNAQGDASPETVRAAISDQAARWLARAGLEIPRDANGCLTAPLEVSPLAALESRDLKLTEGVVIEPGKPFYWAGFGIGFNELTFPALPGTETG